MNNLILRLIYLREVGRLLPCSGKTKREIILQIKNRIHLFCIETDCIDIATLYSHFGTPQQIASMYVDEMETEELISKLSVRNRILKIIFAAAAAIVIIGLITFLSLWLIGLCNELGHIEVGKPNTIS